MNEKHTDLIRRFYQDMWNAFDTSVFPEILDPGIRFRGSLGQEKVGYQELADYVGFIQAFSGDFHNEVIQTITEGDWTFARLSYSGTHHGEVFGVPPTGERFQYAGAAVFHMPGDRIREIWVLGDIHGLVEQLRDHGDAVHIVAYRAEWPDEFTELASTLRAALGNDAIRIDHIGSTSVPGLDAKDKIDIQITTESLDDHLLKPALEAAGFVWRPEFGRDHQPMGRQVPALELEKRVAAAPGYERAANIHLRAEGRFNQRWALLFRDYLRSHPSAATSYAAVKRQLAQVFAGSQPYSMAKDPLVDLIMVAAEEWAETVNWQPPPSDA